MRDFKVQVSRTVAANVCDSSLLVVIMSAKDKKIRWFQPFWKSQRRISCKKPYYFFKQRAFKHI